VLERSSIGGRLDFAEKPQGIRGTLLGQKIRHEVEAHPEIARVMGQLLVEKVLGRIEAAADAQEGAKIGGCGRMTGAKASTCRMAVTASPIAPWR
jgi:hypothetical protein